MTSTRQRVHDVWWTRKLRRHQKILIDTIMRNRFVAILGARQRGKTTAIGYAAQMLAQGVNWTDDNGRKIHIPADDVQLASQTLKHAKDFTKRSSRILSTFNVGLTSNTADQNIFDPKLGSTERIMLANGKQIHAHAGNPDSIQGLSGHTIPDEIASNKHNPEDIFQQGVSVASGAPWRKFVMVGNSSFKGDWWWNFWHGSGPVDGDPGITWEQRRAKFAMVKLDIWSEFPDRILPPDLRDVQDIMGPEAWGRWYECKFAKSHARAIADDLIMRTGIVGPVTPGHAPIVVSIDPGLNRNPTGVVVARVGGFGADVLRAEYWYGPSEGDPVTAEGWIKAQIAQLDVMIQEYLPTYIVVDYSNLAAGLGDALEERYGSMVAKTPTTRDRIQRRWGILLSMLGDGRIAIPAECQDLRDDLERFENDESGSSSRKIEEAGILRLPESPAPAPHLKHVLHCDIGAALLQCMDYAYQDVG